jgi:hypothetical protein
MKHCRLSRLLAVLALLVGSFLAAAGPAAAVPTTTLGPTQPWVPYPYYGQHGTFFLANCGVWIGNSCGPDVIVVVNDAGVSALDYGKVAGPFYGQLGTYADLFSGHLYAVNRNAIYSKVWGAGVGRPIFGPTLRATTAAFYGNLATAFADVDGDGRPDAIAVNTSGVFVKSGRPDGTFGSTARWTSGPFYGHRGTYFADVNGDGRKDAVAVNSSGTTVRLSSGTDFGPNGPSQAGLTSPTGLSFGDITGIGKDSAVWFSPTKVYVFPANGTGFDTAQPMTTRPFYGTLESVIIPRAGGATDPWTWAAVVVNCTGIYYKTPA